MLGIDDTNVIIGSTSDTANGALSYSEWFVSGYDVLKGTEQPAWMPTPYKVTAQNACFMHSLHLVVEKYLRESVKTGSSTVMKGRTEGLRQLFSLQAAASKTSINAGRLNIKRADTRFGDEWRVIKKFLDDQKLWDEEAQKQSLPRNASDIYNKINAPHRGELKAALNDLGILCETDTGAIDMCQQNKPNGTCVCLCACSSVCP